MARLMIRLLGGFQIAVDRIPVTDFRSDKTRALLAYLVVEADQVHARDTLAWMFWPDSPEQAARTNLRSALANLHRLIDDPQASSPHLLIHRETIQFNPTSDHWLDVDAFLAISSVSGSVAAQVQNLEQAVLLYQGAFLHGFSISCSAPFEEWALLKREQLSREVLTVQANLSSYYEQSSVYEKAQFHAWKMVELEPWNEEAYQQLMRVLALGGQRSAALAQFEICKRQLASELNVEPSQETIRLYKLIRDEALRPSSPGLASASPVIQGTFGDSRPLFSGRLPELKKLDGLLQGVLAGQGRVMFITGSAGSGKTTLINEFIARSIKSIPNLVFAVGRCDASTGVGDPYLPFMEVIRMLTGNVETYQPPGAVPAQLARRLVQAAPATIKALFEVGPDLIDRMVFSNAMVERARAFAMGQEEWLIWLKARVENRKTAQQAERVHQTDLFEQYTNVILSVARLNPLALVLDDLQWADIGSISLLFHLGRRISGSQIFILGSYRSEEITLGRNGERHPLEPVIMEFQRGFGEGQIDLDRSDGMAFLEAFLNSQPNCLSRSFREKLFQHTAGHPLFTIELLRGMKDRDELVQDQDGCWTEGEHLDWTRLPARVEAVIAERMERLPQALRRIVNTASVEGEEFTAEVAASVLDIDEEMLVRQISEQLDRKYRLVSALQFRRVGGLRYSRYRFRHSLFQAYLYHSLDDVERAYLHERVGSTLEGRLKVQPDEKEATAVQLARHFEAAGMVNKAVEYFQMAGKRAERLSAREEATAHFHHALDLCQHLPDTLERLQMELALTMALGAQHATRGYLSTETEKTYARAGDLCQEIIRRSGGSPAGSSQLVPVLITLAAFYAGQAQLQSARQMYDQVFSLAQAAGDLEMVMFANWGISHILVHTGDFVTATSHLEKALEVYDPDRHALRYTIFTLDLGVSSLTWLSWALLFLGFPDQAQARSRQAIALARRLGHSYSLAFALTFASVFHYLALDPGGALILAEEAMRINQEKKFPLLLGIATTYRGLSLAKQGAFQEGMAWVKEGYQLHKTSGANIGHVQTLIFSGQALGEVGQVEEGLELLVKALATVTETGEKVCEAEIHRIKGDLTLKRPGDHHVEAEDCYREAIRVAQKQQARILELRATTSLCRLIACQGRREEAKNMLASCYDWFSEGFEAQDLREARRLLEELSIG